MSNRTTSQSAGSALFQLILFNAMGWALGSTLRRLAFGVAGATLGFALGRVVEGAVIGVAVGVAQTIAPSFSPAILHLARRKSRQLDPFQSGNNVQTHVNACRDTCRSNNPALVYPSCCAI